jgi:UTP--glucose-1-phosphate uridylyltransferase
LSVVTKAVIPCGGRGTRMSALTGGAAKELLPVAGIPLLLRVMHECAASGAREILIVSAPGKSDLERVALDAAGTTGMPESVRIVVQETPRGLADAIRMAKDFSGSDAFGVALPDNLFVGEIPALAQVAAVHRRTGKSVVAVVEISAANKLSYGPTAILPGRLNGDEFLIERIPDKGPRQATFDTDGSSSAFTGVGRYVFLPDVFDAIDEVDSLLASGQELDDIPVMQLLLRGEKLTGCRMRGEFLDVGLPAGYRAATERLCGLPSGRS